MVRMKEEREMKKETTIKKVQVKEETERRVKEATEH